ncbi:MAG: right-handed parallel beta-helix repeat-containing protein, partial [Verrucomicrobia bacterium]|nr:right-handed parallel beta-helix repeat-containing protein [Verrucomicrobiota bacterium]
GLPAGGVQVVVRGGAYRLTRTFQLEAQDSGSEVAPVVFRAEQGEHPTFTGGVRLRQFTAVRDEPTLSRLPAEVRSKVIEADLTAHGITNLWPLTLGGFASGRGFTSHPVMELFFDGRPLPLARSPGWVTIAEVSEPASEKLNGLVGSKVGRFTYAGDRPVRWAAEPELLLYGYYFFGWADSYEQVAAIDPAKREITLTPPYHNYGYRKGQPFYAVNALSELDEPGEWFLDRARSRILFLPPSNPDHAVIELSVVNVPFVELKDASNIAFEGLTWQMGCTDAIAFTRGTNCLLAGCTVRQFAGNGVVISGGTGDGILASDLHTLGRGGVVLVGGDRKTLAPGGHYVDNCQIYDLSRIDHTYTPAVLVSGVGQHITHNWLHDIPSSALRVGGNDHVVEFNEINRVVLESDDQGGVDMWGDPTLLGNVYRHNYFHHIGNWRHPDQSPDCGQAGIRLDDAVSGVLIYGNIFYRCASGKLGFGGVQIHGGKDNVLDNNLFADCRWAVSFSPWSEAHWNSFITAPRHAPEIDPARFSARYPAMARLDQDINVNWLYRNVVFDCRAFLHRNGGGVRAFDNLTTTNNPGFADPARGDFSMKQPSADLAEIGFAPLPFAEMGLYSDPYRRRLPEKLIRAQREEQ